MTGLLAPDVFYFGNAIGDSGNSRANAFVDGSDFAAARDNHRDTSNRAAVDFACDYNRDSFVDGVDLAIARDHGTSFLSALKLIAVPSAAAAATVPPESAMPGEGETEEAGQIALLTRESWRIDSAGGLQVDVRGGEAPVWNVAAEPTVQSTPNDAERRHPIPENRPLPARRHAPSPRGEVSQQRRLSRRPA